MNKAHADTMSGHIAKLHKILGTEEAEGMGQQTHDGAPKPQSMDGAAPSLAAAATAVVPKVEGANGAVTKADLDALQASFDAKLTDAVSKAKEEGAEEIIELMVKALGEDEEPKKPTGSNVEASIQNTNKAQAGIGDRGQVVEKTGGGPVVRVVPVSKDADEAAATAAGAAAVAVEEKVDMEKVRRGDKAEVLKFMKGVKVAELPHTLTSVVNRLGGRA